METDKLYHCDCIDLMKGIPDGSVNVILTDPPYLYLKNQKLDRPFDETAFFNEAKRILKKDGFIVLFGRGTSFYRWNSVLSDLGFNFKEEIVWDKSYCTSPLMNIHRVHETVSIHTKKNGTINKVKVPYPEMKRHDISGVIADIKRLKACLNNTKSLNAVLFFLESNQIQYEKPHTDGKAASYHTNSFCSSDEAAATLRSITLGMNEKTIIKQAREHYATIHPTQKPARLLERLLALVSRENDIVFDPFSGSGSTAIACINTNRRFIACEIDGEYYHSSHERIQNHLREKQKEVKQPALF